MPKFISGKGNTGYGGRGGTRRATSRPRKRPGGGTRTQCSDATNMNSCYQLGFEGIFCDWVTGPAHNVYSNCGSYNTSNSQAECECHCSNGHQHPDCCGDCAEWFSDDDAVCHNDCNNYCSQFTVQQCVPAQEPPVQTNCGDYHSPGMCENNGCTWCQHPSGNESCMNSCPDAYHGQMHDMGTSVYEQVARYSSNCQSYNSSNSQAECHCTCTDGHYNHDCCGDCAEWGSDDDDICAQDCQNYCAARSGHGTPTGGYNRGGKIRRHRRTKKSPRRFNRGGAIRRRRRRR